MPSPDQAYQDVDVALVMESTYPYLKGGVSAVVHDIVVGNQDLSFGIIHITWDSHAPHEDLYGMPANVKWVRPVYLSMNEHRDDFTTLTPRILGMRAKARTRLANRLFDALEGILAGDMSLMWDLYDEGMNPRTRTFPLWALLGTKEFMTAVRDRLTGLGLPLVDTFWLLREYFSLACAVMSEDLPTARVYHAHTTGYASLLGTAAARQNDTAFLLTEHNLYVRDTVNLMLNRSMALPLSARDWREFDVSAQERAWMAWWIEMARFAYPSAEAITYLYPKAITEAADLGAPVEKSVIIPNGMIVRDFDGVYQQRLRALEEITTADPGTRTWRLVYVARIVPIKGLSDLISTIGLLVHERGITNFHLDILGPTDHFPDYYMMCREKARTLNIEDYLTFHGTVKVREMLGDFDILVLPSFNEGQPIVVLEAMTAGIPTVGTSVGGMEQLIADPLTTPGGRTVQACGLLVTPDYVRGMADALQQLMGDVALYARFAHNAHARVENFFQLEDAMGAYNRLYKELAGLPAATLTETVENAGQDTAPTSHPSPTTPSTSGGAGMGGGQRGAARNEPTQDLDAELRALTDEDERVELSRPASVAARGTREMMVPVPNPSGRAVAEALHGRPTAPPPDHQRHDTIPAPGALPELPRATGSVAATRSRRGARGVVPGRSVAAVAIAAILAGGVISLVTDASASNAGSQVAPASAVPAPPKPSNPPPTTAATPPPILAHPTPTSPVPAVPITYTVVKGDTLSSIAQWFHHRGYGALYEANKAVLGNNPNLIHPGQRIAIAPTGMTVG